MTAIIARDTDKFGRTHVALRAADRLDRSVSCRPPPIQTGTNRRQDLQHVAHQIVGDLTRIQHHKMAVLRRQHCSTDSVFTRSNRSRCSTTTAVTCGSASNRRTFPPRAIHPGANLGSNLARIIDGARFVVVDGMGHDLPGRVWRPIVEALTEDFGH
jgi:hypothetical protein